MSSYLYYCCVLAGGNKQHHCREYKHHIMKTTSCEYTAPIIIGVMKQSRSFVSVADNFFFFFFSKLYSPTRAHCTIHKRRIRLIILFVIISHARTSLNRVRRRDRLSVLAHVEHVKCAHWWACSGTEWPDWRVEGAGESSR